MPEANLAINGGPKAFETRVGVPQPKIGVEEFLSIAERFGFKPEVLARLRDSLRDEDLLGNGPNLARWACPYPEETKGPQFEALACEKFGVKHALAVSSGTGALHAAFVAAGARAGKEVVVPAIGFLATSAAAALTGAAPVFCDVDESLHLDPTKLEACITPNTVAVAPTHHWGGVCDMAPVVEIARRHGLVVIEDCAQSPGAHYRGRYVGSIGDIGCFSISAYKIIGGGEGGMVVSSDTRLFERAFQLAECGGLWRPDRFAPPRWEGELFVGTNYRLSELESAVDLVQLRKLDDVVSRFQAVSRRVRCQLETFREIVPQKHNDPEGEIGYLLRFFPRTHELAGRIAEALRAEGIGAGTRGPQAGPDWHLCKFMFPVLAGAGSDTRAGQCPVAEELYGRAVSIGLDQWWAPEDCDAVAAGINKVLRAYCTPGGTSREW